MKFNLRGFVLFLHSHPFLMSTFIKIFALTKGILVTTNKDQIEIIKLGKKIILRRSNLAYSRDVILNFDFYHGATQDALKDFSRTAPHTITGFDSFRVMTPGLPEPMKTINQYCELLELKEGDTVIDLGAYSGLSSIVFSQRVGKTGRVLSIEADPLNGKCCENNFADAYETFGHSPNLVNKAIWNIETTIEYIPEGNLGSAVKMLLPRANIESVMVKTTTLSRLVSDFGLTRVDAIKADIEGSEFWAFSDKLFFEKFHPTIIFEPADEDLEETKSRRVIELLNEYGYRCSFKKQPGSSLPLIVCQ